jgi:hypothetical protein
MEELPKTVYMFWFKDGDDQWLHAEEEIDGCAEHGEVRLVGKYQLVEVASVSLEVKANVIVTPAETAAVNVQ